MGKLAGGASLLATGKGLGLLLSGLRMVSSRAFYWILGSTVGVAIGVPIVAKVIEQQKIEVLFPRWSATQSRNEKEQGQAAFADFNDLSKSTLEAMSLSIEATNQLIDQTIAELSRRIVADPRLKFDLERKIAILKAARSVTAENE